MKVDDAQIDYPTRTAASVPTPIAGTVTVFVDSANGHYSQKDSAGVVTDLVADPAGGATTQILVNNGGVETGFAGLTYVDSQGLLLGANKDLILSDSQTPVTPPANTLAYIAKKDTGLMLPKIVYSDATSDTLLVSPHENATIHTFFPASAAVGSGTGFGGNWTNAGQVSHPVLASTNKWTAVPVSRYANVVTTTNQALGIITNTFRFWTGNAAGLGGFRFFARFGIGLIPAATIRLFAGLASVSPIAADAVTGDCIGLWHDTVDALTTLNILTRNNVTSTKTAITVPALAAGQAFEFTLTFPPNGTSAFYKLVNYLTGAVLAESTIAVTLPRNTAFMAPAVLMSNGTANITANTVALDVNAAYARSLT